MKFLAVFVVVLVASISANPLLGSVSKILEGGGDTVNGLLGGLNLEETLGNVGLGSVGKTVDNVGKLVGNTADNVLDTLGKTTGGLGDTLDELLESLNLNQLLAPLKPILNSLSLDKLVGAILKNPIQLNGPLAVAVRVSPKIDVDLKVIQQLLSSGNQLSASLKLETTGSALLALNVAFKSMTGITRLDSENWLKVGQSIVDLDLKLKAMINAGVNVGGLNLNVSIDLYADALIAVKASVNSLIKSIQKTVGDASIGANVGVNAEAHLALSILSEIAVKLAVEVAVTVQSSPLFTKLPIDVQDLLKSALSLLVKILQGLDKIVDDLLNGVLSDSKGLVAYVPKLVNRLTRITNVV